MRGDEGRVVRAFCDHLTADGWTVEREVNYVDVTAERDSLTIYAEVKGRTASMGLDVDTLYGQLLRRVPNNASGAILGVVVPESAVAAALRVAEWVRDQLNIYVWAVADDDSVRLVSRPRGEAPRQFR